MLISGDADLTPGVIAAQNLGIRVHLLSMGPAAATSPYLRCEVDLKEHWDDATVKLFVTAAKATVTPIKASAAPVAPSAAIAMPAPVTAAASSPMLVDAAKKAHAEVDPAILAAATAKGPIPKEIDGKLLFEARSMLGRPLTEAEKRQARVEFRKLL